MAVWKDVKKAALSLLVLPILALSLEADGRKAQYQQFLELSPEQREKTVKRYVRQADEFWVVKQGIYTVYCTTSPERALECAIFMQDFAGKIDKFFKAKPKGRFNPTVYLCKDKVAMRNLLLQDLGGIAAVQIPEWIDGLYHQKNQKLYVHDGKSANKMLLHEGTHQYMNYLLGGNYRFLPVWINEGLATSFETWDLSGDADTNVAKNRERSNHRFTIREMFKQDPLPLTLRGLMAKDRMTWVAAKGMDIHYQYAVAWSFTDYMLNCEDGRSLLKQVCQWAYKSQTNKSIPDKVLEYHDKSWQTYVIEKVLPNIPENVKIKYD